MRYSLQRRVTSFIAATSVAFTISACADNVCEIEGQHVHLYNNPTTGISLLITGEEQQVGEYQKTDVVKPKTELEEFIAQNNLVNIAECDESFVDTILNSSGEYEETLNEAGELQVFYVTNNYRFLQIVTDPTTGKFYVVEQYVKNIEDRLPGFNYFQEDKFVFKDHHPINVLIK